MTDPIQFRRYLRQLQEQGVDELVLGERPDFIESEAGQDAVADDQAAHRPSSHSTASDGGTAGRRPTGSGTKGSSSSGPGQDVPEIPPSGIEIEAESRDLFKEDPLAELDLEEIAARVSECRLCELCSGRTLAVPGEGSCSSGLAVVGEGPGAKEDETGRPFVGRAGDLLTKILSAIGLSREEVFICNVVKCRPPGNRKPLQEEIDSCVPYLYRQLEILDPKVILAMGSTAAETLLKTRQSLGSLRSRVHRFRGIPLIVTYHPAALLRNPNWKKPTWDDVRIARRLLG